MSHKELSAWVMAFSAVVISSWIVWEAMSGGLAATPQDAAMRMLWAIGQTIALNIVAVIIGVIGLAIVTRHEVKDERADERDRLVAGYGMRNGYFVLAIGVALLLAAQAFGLIDALLAPYALFLVSMLAGAVFAVSQIVYYRVS